MRDKYRSPGRWGLSVFATCVGAGIAAGGYFGSIADHPDQGRLDKAREVIEVQSGAVEEANRNLFRVQQEIGEACMSFVNIYLGSGPLAGTSEEIAVNDIKNEPGTPCGETLSKTRVAYRTTLAASGTLAQAEEGRARAEHSLERAEALAEDSSITDGRAMGGIIGFVAGIGIGVAVANELDYYNPPKRRREI